MANPCRGPCGGPSTPRVTTPTRPLYIQRTSNGGLQNSRWNMRGAFVGSGLPALPLVGFGALALSLAVIGGRALVGKK